MVLVGLCMACSRERVNSDCQWTHDTTFRIDLTNRSHQTHLRHDADLMEDLAIRYADAHVGRGARPEWPEVRDACMPKLFAQFIETTDASALDAGCLERLSAQPPFAGNYGWEP